jgi:thioredoxin reductase (NADPH)
VRYRRLDVPRLAEFEGVCVFYAATQVEAASCVSEPVVVVGGGNSAAQAALFLASRAAKVWLVVREPELDANVSRYLADRIERTAGIEVLLHSEVRDLRGGTSLEAVVVEDRLTEERRVLPATRLFVFIGAEPHTDWLRGEVELDERGFVLTGPLLAQDGPPGHRRPLALETSRPGVLAAGDVRAGSVRRMASAVGDGAMAIRLAHAFLAAADVQGAPVARQRSSTPA